MKKKTTKPPFPQKGTIVILLKNGLTLSGIGYIEAVKNTAGDFIFTATLVKDYKKKRLIK